MGGRGAGGGGKGGGGGGGGGIEVDMASAEKGMDKQLDKMPFSGTPPRGTTIVQANAGQAKFNKWADVWDKKLDAYTKKFNKLPASLKSKFTHPDDYIMKGG